MVVLGEVAVSYERGTPVPESRGHNMAVTVLYVVHSLDSGLPLRCLLAFHSVGYGVFKTPRTWGRVIKFELENALKSIFSELVDLLKEARSPLSG